jgi:hypothetical protein
MDSANSVVKGNPCYLLNYSLVSFSAGGLCEWLAAGERERRKMHVVTVAEFFFTAQGPMNLRVNGFHEDIKGGLTQLV